MLDQIDDTIVAISSPPGRSAVGIVRLTGRDAITIVDRLACMPDSLAAQPGSSQVEARVRIAPDSTIPARFFVFHKPRSYTRENLVEIHTVGAPVVLEMIRQEAIALGAKPAAPGAFTARALIHGAMDLPQAEAVGKLIHAQTDAQLRAARKMMDGSLGRKIHSARDQLAEVLALVEADMDFAEEPIEFITPHDLGQRLGQVRDSLLDLRRRAVSIERIAPTPHILLLGPPNAGKSTLLNALTNSRRAISADVAGTTRDLLAAPIKIGRGEAIILDSAGVDQSQDEILRQARALTLDAAQHVDLVCIVLDTSARPDEDFLAQTRDLDLPAVIVVASKCDRLPNRGTPSPPLPQGEGRGEGPPNCGTGFQTVDALFPTLNPDWPIYRVSALQQTGLDDLRKAMTDHIQETPSSTAAQAIILGERQRASVDQAIAALERALDLAAKLDDTIDSGDLIAFETREALDALATVTGAVTTEDLLTKIFANFCIGK